MAEEVPLDRLTQALAATHQEELWPDWLALPDAVEELSRWIEDPRQWASARPGNWSSLMNDVAHAIGAFGTETKELTSANALRAEAQECRKLLRADENRADTALRHRLRRLVDAIRERFCSTDALLCAWEDLVLRLPNPTIAERSARQLLALAAWLGHDPKSLRDQILRKLGGRSLPPDNDAPKPPSERIADVQRLLGEPPAKAHMVVWLTYVFAKVPGEWIDVGDSVRIFQADWLRQALCKPTENAELLPAEALLDYGGDGSFSPLAIFCSARVEPDPSDRPTAFIRVDLGDELRSRALEIARDTAEAIASIGVLYGAEPTLWRLQESFILFADGRSAGGSTSADVVGGATFAERIGVERDRTAEQLAEVPGLGENLPVRDPDVHAATTLLAWLRQARTSPAPLRLVLFDRVVEAVCGWAGVSSLPRFVSDALLPWWAYNRIRREISAAGFAAVWNTPLARAPTPSPSRTTFLEILNHEPLGLRGGAGTIDLQGVLTEVQWLGQRIPPDSDGAQQLRALEQRTRTGKATAAWWSELCENGARLEQRRQRTRNALVHGGPVAPATVEGVALFADHLAGEALAASVDGRLARQDLVDYFLDRERRMADIRAGLANGARPAEILFWEP